MKITRRRFIGSLAATSLFTPAVLGAASGRPKVVIVGGGAGGATVAHYLGKNSAGAIDVTLIEPTRRYYSCFFSNLYLGGVREFESLGHSYGTLASDFGVNVVHDWVIGVDRDARTVSLASGGTMGYDKLVLSPGIDFIEGAVEGWSTASQNKMPHAYKAGSQTQLLKAQIEAMPQGGTYAMVAPPNPFRCPPGPYERVSMVAHRFKEINPTAKILILDPKEQFSKMDLFQEAWGDDYAGMIDWIGADFGGADVSVNPDAMEISIEGEIEKVDVCNVIPAMKAGHICEQAGLTQGNWVPVEPQAMTSRMDSNIHVIGDSSLQGDMPKSGFSANSQAKVVANTIRGQLIGSTIFPARYSSTCWSLLGTDNGVKVGASYEAGEDKITKVDGFISQVGESADVRRQTYEESVGWYEAISSDIFG